MEDERTGGHEPCIFAFLEDAIDDFFDDIEMRTTEEDRMPTRPRIRMKDESWYADIVVERAALFPAADGQLTSDEGRSDSRVEHDSALKWQGFGWSVLQCL